MRPFFTNLPKLLCLAVLGVAFLPFAAVQAADPEPGEWINTTFVITNDSAFQDDTNIWVSFNYGVPTNSPSQTYGNGHLFEPGTLGADNWQSYRLSDFKTTVPSITNPSMTGDIYSFSLNNYNGRILISFGQKLTEPPSASYPVTAPFVIFETTVVGQVNQPPNPALPVGPTNMPGASASNIDLSYVDGASIAAGTYVSANDGTVLNATTINPVTTNNGLVSHLAGIVPEGAKVRDSQGNVTRILSGSTAPNGTYHDWDALLGQIETNHVTIGDYRSPQDSDLKVYGLDNQLFGYSGAGAIEGQAENFENAQGYTAQVTYNSTTGILTITGTGVQNDGGPAAAGAFTITLTKDALNNGGVYGENPAYTVTTGSGSYTTTGIVNDLGGRVVGDLLAGMVFGWAASDTQLQDLGIDLTDSGLDGTTKVRELSTGQFFFLASLGAAQGKIADVTGAGLTGNSDFYDIYSYEASKFTSAYVSGFGDRFQGTYGPNTTWYTAYPPADPNTTVAPPPSLDTVGYVELRLSHAPEFSAVPEPSTYLLFVGSGAALLLLSRRKKPAR